MKILSGVIIENSHCLTLDEFSRAIKTEKTIVIEMVEYNLFLPQGGKLPEEWRFDSVSLKRGRMAASFLHDLEVNMPGVALALELMDKIEDLQQQLAKH